MCHHCKAKKNIRNSHLKECATLKLAQRNIYVVSLSCYSLLLGSFVIIIMYLQPSLTFLKTTICINNLVGMQGKLNDQMFEDFLNKFPGIKT